MTEKHILKELKEMVEDAQHIGNGEHLDITENI